MPFQRYLASWKILCILSLLHKLHKQKPFACRTCSQITVQCPAILCPQVEPYNHIPCSPGGNRKDPLSPTAGSLLLPSSSISSTTESHWTNASLASHNRVKRQFNVLCLSIKICLIQFQERFPVLQNY